MMASLAVYVAMANKVDRETLGAAILPQLWMMAMTPLLSADQFSQFMSAIQDMGQRVQKEQLAHLRDMKRMQEHTDSYVSGGSPAPAAQSGGGEVDFATLVGASGSGGTAAGLPTRSAHIAPSSVTITPTLTPSHTGSPAFLTPSATGTSTNVSSSGFSPTPLAPSAPPARPRASPSPSPLAGQTVNQHSFFSQLQTTPLSASTPLAGPPPVPSSALSVSGLGASLPPLIPTSSSLGSLSQSGPTDSQQHASPGPSVSSSWGLPPLVPTSSSLGQGGAAPLSKSRPMAAGVAAGMLTPSAAPNRIGTPSSRAASPASAGAGASASAGVGVGVGLGASATQPAASWSGGMLTPSKPPQPARAALDWADFDPLK